MAEPTLPTAWNLPPPMPASVRPLAGTLGEELAMEAEALGEALRGAPGPVQQRAAYAQSVSLSGPCWQA